MSEDLGGFMIGICNGVLQEQEAPFVIVLDRVWASVERISRQRE